MNIDLGAANEEAGDSGRTEVGDYNPLKLERETHLTLEYAVEVTDPDLAGGFYIKYADQKKVKK